MTTLANPNLTALSGETGTFLAGGEIPIPITQALGTVSIEYKQFGVSLAYTPTVLSDGRISLRVRPEVSQLDYSNAVPSARRASPRSPRAARRRRWSWARAGFMIAGLLSNTHNNFFDKTPGVGDVPILGALFKSNAFQRNETELVIVITPYLVKPTNANDIRLPTDGYKAPTDLDRVLLGKLDAGQSGRQRPMPTMQAAPAAARRSAPSHPRP
ncbi:type II and III secretion system protein family protein [Sphingomonas sp. MMS24-JH45]